MKDPRRPLDATEVSYLLYQKIIGDSKELKEEPVIAAVEDKPKPKKANGKPKSPRKKRVSVQS